MIRTSLVFVAMLAIALITMVAIGAASGSSGKKFGSTTTVSIGSQGTLASGGPFGGGVNVSVSYSCFPGGNGGGPYPGGGAFGSVNVTDLSGDQGFGNFTPTCDDTKQTAVVFVAAFPILKGGSASFVAGDAAASAVICGFDCNFTTREIKIS